MTIVVHFAQEVSFDGLDVIAQCSGRPIDLERDIESWTTNRQFCNCDGCLEKPEVETKGWKTGGYHPDQGKNDESLMRRIEARAWSW